MALFFDEHHQMSLALPHLYPGEQVAYRARGLERPWWASLLLGFGSLFARYLLLVATNQRLLLIRHKTVFGGYAENGFEAVPWPEIERAELGWGVFTKTLRVSAHARRWRHAIRLGRFWSRGNFVSGEGIVLLWRQHRHPPAVRSAA